MLSITVLNADQVQRILGRDLTTDLAAMTKAVAAVIQDRLAPYPPATEANSPKTGWIKGGPNYWYERGYGPRWIRKDGSYNSAKTSEMMNRQWTIEPTASTSHILGNRATYARWLHSSEEQVTWAGPRGWVTDRKAVEQTVASGDIERIAAEALAKMLGS